MEEYKESAAKRNITIAEEFARREAIARDVPNPLIFSNTNSRFYRHFKKPLNRLRQHPLVHPLFPDYLVFELSLQYLQQHLNKGNL